MPFGVQEVLEPNLVAQYGFIGVLLILTVSGTVGVWKGVKWAGMRTIGDNGILTVFLQKQEDALVDISTMVHGMSSTTRETHAVMADSKDLMANLRDVASDLVLSVGANNTKASNTNQALCHMADAILASTPHDQQEAVRKHVTEIKHILQERHTA